jgi:hypothetical protein
MLRKNSAILLILFIVGLYLVQNKGVIPFVTKVAESDLFFEKGVEEDEELGNIRNARTDFAFTHCKSAFKDEYNLDDKADLNSAEYEAWALGNRTYLIRSSVRMPDESQKMTEQHYACKIQYLGNEESSPANWTVGGIDFNP